MDINKALLSTLNALGRQQRATQTAFDAMVVQQQTALEQQQSMLKDMTSLAGRSKEGILGPKQFANIGRSVVITPDLAPAVPPGPAVFIKESSLPSIVAVQQYSGETLGFAVDSFLLKDGAAGSAQFVQLQCSLTFETGTSMFGVLQETSLSSSGIAYHSDITFDIQGGAYCTIAGATSVTPTFRYIASNTGGFPAGSQVGPQARVNYGISYAPPGGSPSILTYTEVPVNLPNDDDSVTWTKPKFAEAVTFRWLEWDTNVPLIIEFISFSGTVMWTINYNPLTAVEQPIFFPWPLEAVEVRVSNGAGEGKSMSFVTAVHRLKL